MENLCSSSSQPSGVRLLALLQGQWKEILRREESNVSLMHLYGTGTHWVAFERSAFHLCHIYTKSVINAMKVFRVPLPIVVTSVEDREMPFAVGDMECMKRTFVERIYKTGKPVDGKSFNEWHYQNTIVFQDTGYRRS